eukprot:scaffold2144_cov215-Pinguiococcus_pyrenoidosus.AAC.2
MLDGALAGLTRNLSDGAREVGSVGRRNCAALARWRVPWSEASSSHIAGSSTGPSEEEGRNEERRQMA